MRTTVVKLVQHSVGRWEAARSALARRCFSSSASCARKRALRVPRTAQAAPFRSTRRASTRRMMSLSANGQSMYRNRWASRPCRGRSAAVTCVWWWVTGYACRSSGCRCALATAFFVSQKCRHGDRSSLRRPSRCWHVGTRALNQGTQPTRFPTCISGERRTKHST